LLIGAILACPTLSREVGTTRTLDSHACRLRHKLGADGDRFVVNVWGVGYRLVDGPVAA